MGPASVVEVLPSWGPAEGGRAEEASSEQLLQEARGEVAGVLEGTDRGQREQG